MQHGQESLSALAKRRGVNQKTVAKWRKRTSGADLPTGPREPTLTAPSGEEEAVVLAFRRRTSPPLDDCLHALQPTIPHMTRSSPHGRLARHDVSRLPDMRRRENGVGRRITRVRRPRTVKDAAVKRFHYDSRQQFKLHLADFINACDSGRRPRTLGGLTPYEHICTCWTAEPNRFRLDPIHQMPGLNT